MDPDPGGPKTRGSGGSGFESGSATLPEGDEIVGGWVPLHQGRLSQAQQPSHRLLTPLGQLLYIHHFSNTASVYPPLQ